jgi:hypothetical protein
LSSILSSKPLGVAKFGSVVRSLVLLHYELSKVESMAFMSEASGGGWSAKYEQRKRPTQ